MYEVFVVLLLAVVAITSGIVAFNGINNAMAGDFFALCYGLPGCIFCLFSSVMVILCALNTRRRIIEYKSGEQRISDSYEEK